MSWRVKFTNPNMKLEGWLFVHMNARVYQKISLTTLWKLSLKRLMSISDIMEQHLLSHIKIILFSG